MSASAFFCQAKRASAAASAMLAQYCCAAVGCADEASAVGAGAAEQAWARRGRGGSGLALGHVRVPHEGFDGRAGRRSRALRRRAPGDRGCGANEPRRLGRCHHRLPSLLREGGCRREHDQEGAGVSAHSAALWPAPVATSAAIVTCRIIAPPVGLQRAGRLDRLQDGDDALRLQADPVEAADQRLQVGAAHDGELPPFSLTAINGVRRDDRLAAREGLRLGDLGRLGDAHRQVAVRHRHGRDLHVAGR